MTSKADKLLADLRAARAAKDAASAAVTKLQRQYMDACSTLTAAQKNEQKAWDAIGDAIS